MTEPRDDAPAPLAKEMGRREFVKTAAGGVAALAAGAAMAAMGTGLRNSLREKVSYLGAKVVRGGPANWGLPIIPLALDAEGRLEVVPSNLAAHGVACAPEAPGLDRAWPGDNFARFLVPEGRIAGLTGDEARRLYPYLDRVGQPIRKTDLEALRPGDGIAFVWRSDVPEPADAFQDRVLRGLLIRVDPARMTGEDIRPLMLPEPPVVAFNSACTHLCCVSGWHEDEAARSSGSWDHVFCACHFSRFDPYTIERYEFDAETSLLERNREEQRRRGVLGGLGNGEAHEEMH